MKTEKPTLSKTAVSPKSIQHNKTRSALETPDTECKQQNPSKQNLRQLSRNTEETITQEVKESEF